MIEKGVIKLDSPGKITGNIVYDDTEYFLEKEFDALVSKWHSIFIFSAHGSADPTAKPAYEELKKWCIEHKNIALQLIKKNLEYEPSDLVTLLDDIWGEEYKVSIEGFMTLDVYCNLWLNVLDGIDNKVGKINIKDYYKDYNTYHKYMKKHYIPWNPYKEDDPNVTFEEFKQGKRNKKK